MSPGDTNRLPWIDTLKAIGVTLVILGHTVGVPPLVLQVIFASHIPLFFWMSGLVGTGKVRLLPFRDYLRERAHRRLLPYLAVAMGSYLLWVLLLRHFGTRQAAAIPWYIPLVGILYGSDTRDFLAPNVVLWFFPCLLVTEIFFYFLARLPSRLALGGALMVSSLLGFVAPTFLPWRLPWGLELALTAVVFYGIGYLCQPYLVSFHLSTGKRWLLLLSSLILYVAGALYNRPVAFIIGNYGGNYGAFYVAAFAGILFWSLWAQILQRSRLLQVIGQQTLVLFSLHLLVFPLFTGFFLSVLRLPPNFREQSVLYAVLYTILAIALLTPVSLWLGKHCPLLLGQKPLRRQTGGEPVRDKGQGPQQPAKQPHTACPPHPGHQQGV